MQHEVSEGRERQKLGKLCCFLGGRVGRWQLKNRWWYRFFTAKGIDGFTLYWPLVKLADRRVPSLFLGASLFWGTIQASTTISLSRATAVLGQRYVNLALKQSHYVNQKTTKPSSMTTSFEQLKQITDDKGVEAGLDFLEQHVRRDKDFARLFEVLKMRVRHGMGLPILYSRTRDSLSEADQRQLEDGLLAACREVGTLFLKQGDLAHGWNYLQPVGDRELNEKLIRGLKVDDQNSDDVIEVAVSQGAAPAYGFQLLLQRYGTCDAITTFDQVAHGLTLDVQREMAATLVCHLYDELVGNLINLVTELKPISGEMPSLNSILESGKLAPESACVIDATHLSSVVRISRILQDPELIQRACELSRFGDSLADDLKYPGEVPFEDVYPDHLFYYSAILGQDVDAGLDHFRKKIDQHGAQQYGGMVIETYVELLARVGRNDDAIDVLTEQLLGRYPAMGIAPEAHELAETAKQKQKLLEHFQGASDLLGFGQTLWHKHQDE